MSKARIGIVLVAILLTSSIGLINPLLLKLLIDVAIPRLDFGLLNLFVGLMIVLPIVCYALMTLEVWLVFWALNYYNPEEHPKVSKAELDYIQLT